MASDRRTSQLSELAAQEAELVGAWFYGSKPTEYRIAEGLRFEGPHASHGTLSGHLQPKSGWLQAALQSSKGDFAGFIRLRLNKDEGTVTSHFKGAGRATWGGAITAHRRPLPTTTGVSSAKGFSAGCKERGGPTAATDGSAETRDHDAELQKAWKNLMVATGRSSAPEDESKSMSLQRLLESSSDEEDLSTDEASWPRRAAAPEPGLSSATSPWPARPSAEIDAKPEPQGRPIPPVVSGPVNETVHGRSVPEQEARVPRPQAASPSTAESAKPELQGRPSPAVASRAVTATVCGGSFSQRVARPQAASPSTVADAKPDPSPAVASRAATETVRGGSFSKQVVQSARPQAASPGMVADAKPELQGRPSPPAVSGSVTDTVRGSSLPEQVARSARPQAASPSAAASVKAEFQEPAEGPSKASSSHEARMPRHAAAPGVPGSGPKLSSDHLARAAGTWAPSLTAGAQPQLQGGLIDVLNAYGRLIEEKKLLAVNFRPGVKVREGCGLTSQALGRYPDLTIVERLAQVGTRMQVRLREGSGPDEGWVSCMIDGKGVFSLIGSLKEFRDVQMAGNLQPSQW